jgi:hypothetical protein
MHTQICQMSYVRYAAVLCQHHMAGLMDVTPTYISKPTSRNQKEACGGLSAVAHSCCAACDSCRKNVSHGGTEVSPRNRDSSRSLYAQDRSSGRRFLAPSPGVTSLPLHQIEDTRRSRPSRARRPALRLPPSITGAPPPSPPSPATTAATGSRIGDSSRCPPLPPGGSPPRWISRLAFQVDLAAPRRAHAPRRRSFLPRWRPRHLSAPPPGSAAPRSVLPSAAPRASPSWRPARRRGLRRRDRQRRWPASPRPRRLLVAVFLGSLEPGSSPSSPLPPSRAPSGGAWPDPRP